MKVRNWYIKNYPTDDMGRGINPKLTFIEVLGALERGEDIYSVIWVYDSVIRERIFERVSELMGVPYDTIYDKWLAI